MESPRGQSRIRSGAVGAVVSKKLPPLLSTLPAEVYRAYDPEDSSYEADIIGRELAIREKTTLDSHDDWRRTVVELRTAILDLDTRLAQKTQLLEQCRELSGKHHALVRSIRRDKALIAFVRDKTSHHRGTVFQRADSNRIENNVWQNDSIIKDLPPQFALHADFIKCLRSNPPFIAIASRKVDTSAPLQDFYRANPEEVAFLETICYSLFNNVTGDRDWNSFRATYRELLYLDLATRCDAPSSMFHRLTTIPRHFQSRLLGLRLFEMYCERFVGAWLELPFRKAFLRVLHVTMCESADPAAADLTSLDLYMRVRACRYRPNSEEPTEDRPQSFELFGNLFASERKIDSSEEKTAMAEVEAAQPLQPSKREMELEKERIRRERHERQALVFDELVESEKKYVEHIGNLMTFYMEPLTVRKQELGLTDEQLSTIFFQIDAVHKTNSQLSEELTEIYTEFMKDDLFAKGRCVSKKVAHVFKRLAPFLKVYRDYVGSYDNCLATINALKGNKLVQAFLNKSKVEIARVIGKRYSMLDYLIMPIQRLPRYLLLLQDLAKSTEVESEGYLPLREVLGQLEQIARGVNDRKRQVEQMTKLLSIQSKLKGLESFDTQLMQPHRKFLREGTVYLEKKGKLKQYYTVLFSDSLLWASSSSSQAKEWVFIEPGKCSVFKPPRLMPHAYELLAQKEWAKNAPTEAECMYSLTLAAKGQSVHLVFDTTAERDGWLLDIQKVLRVDDRTEQIESALMETSMVKTAVPVPESDKASSMQLRKKLLLECVKAFTSTLLDSDFVESTPTEFLHMMRDTLFVAEQVFSETYKDIRLALVAKLYYSVLALPALFDCMHSGAFIELPVKSARANLDLVLRSVERVLLQLPFDKEDDPQLFFLNDYLRSCAPRASAVVSALASRIEALPLIAPSSSARVASICLRMDEITRIANYLFQGSNIKAIEHQSIFARLLHFKDMKAQRLPSDILCTHFRIPVFDDDNDGSVFHTLAAERTHLPDSVPGDTRDLYMRSVRRFFEVITCLPEDILTAENFHGVDVGDVQAVLSRVVERYHEKLMTLNDSAMTATDFQSLTGGKSSANTEVTVPRLLRVQHLLSQFVTGELDPAPFFDCIKACWQQGSASVFAGVFHVGHAARLTHENISRSQREADMLQRLIKQQRVMVVTRFDVSCKIRIAGQYSRAAHSLGLRALEEDNWFVCSSLSGFVDEFLEFGDSFARSIPTAARVFEMFLDAVEKQLILHSPNTEVDMALDFAEEYLTTALFDRLFRYEIYVEQDTDLSNKIESIQSWALNGRALNPAGAKAIGFAGNIRKLLVGKGFGFLGQHGLLTPAVAALRRMEDHIQYRTPKRKLALLCECYHWLTSNLALVETSFDAQSEKATTVQVLVYLLLLTKPACLVSCLSYIQQFRPKRYLSDSSVMPVLLAFHDAVHVIAKELPVEKPVEKSPTKRVTLSYPSLVSQASRKGHRREPSSLNRRRGVVVPHSDIYLLLENQQSARRLFKIAQDMGMEKDLYFFVDLQRYKLYPAGSYAQAVALVRLYDRYIKARQSDASGAGSSVGVITHKLLSLTEKVKKAVQGEQTNNVVRKDAETFTWNEIATRFILYESTEVQTEEDAGSKELFPQAFLLSYTTFASPSQLAKVLSQWFSRDGKAIAADLSSLRARSALSHLDDEKDGGDNTSRVLKGCILPPQAVIEQQAKAETKEPALKLDQREVSQMPTALDSAHDQLAHMLRATVLHEYLKERTELDFRARSISRTRGTSAINRDSISSQVSVSSLSRRSDSEISQNDDILTDNDLIWVMSSYSQLAHTIRTTWFASYPQDFDSYVIEHLLSALKKIPRKQWNRPSMDVQSAYTSLQTEVQELSRLLASLTKNVQRVDTTMMTTKEIDRSQVFNSALRGKKVALQLAQQLAIASFALLKDIPPRELAYNWASSETASAHASHWTDSYALEHYVEFHTGLSAFVMNHIKSMAKDDKKLEAIRFFVDVTELCLDNGNFECAFAIADALSGKTITHAVVSHLWTALEPRYQDKWKAITRLTSDNYHTYHNHIGSLEVKNLPRIPLLCLLLDSVISTYQWQIQTRKAIANLPKRAASTRAGRRAALVVPSMPSRPLSAVVEDSVSTTSSSTAKGKKSPSDVIDFAPHRAMYMLLKSHLLDIPNYDIAPSRPMQMFIHQSVDEAKIDRDESQYFQRVQSTLTRLRTVNK